MYGKTNESMGKAANRGKSWTEIKTWQIIGSDGATCRFILFLIGIKSETKNAAVLK
jgi:hypothetical protein